MNFIKKIIGRLLPFIVLLDPVRNQDISTSKSEDGHGSAFQQSREAVPTLNSGPKKRSMGEDPEMIDNAGCAQSEGISKFVYWMV
jgi:hypothetical protein